MHIRSLLRTGFAAAFVATSMGAATSAFATQDNQQPRQGNDLSGLHAFDSRVGCWTFHNRVLRERLSHSHDWFEYDAKQRFWQVMGGYGNMDENWLNKVRYRGIAKNHNRLCVNFALINLYHHRKRLAVLAA